MPLLCYSILFTVYGGIIDVLINISARYKVYVTHRYSSGLSQDIAVMSDL